VEGDPELREILIEVISYFPELSEYRFTVFYSNISNYAMEQTEILRGSDGSAEKRARIEVSMRARAFSREAKKALLIHELGHIILQEGKGDDYPDDEFGASWEGIKRVHNGLTLFRELFRNICAEPCWRVEEHRRLVDGGVLITKEVKWRRMEMGGIKCVDPDNRPWLCPWRNKFEEDIGEFVRDQVEKRKNPNLRISAVFKVRGGAKRV